MPVAQSKDTLPAIDLLLAYLEGEGVDYIFGIPGGPLMPLYEGIFARKRIRPIFGQARGRGGVHGRRLRAGQRAPGRLLRDDGPRRTNALTGIACAPGDSVPRLILTAQIATAAFGKGAAQESPSMGHRCGRALQAVTKASLMLASPEKMPEMVRMFCARPHRPARPRPPEPSRRHGQAASSPTARRRRSTARARSISTGSL